jgi:hypothetical protein
MRLVLGQVVRPGTTCPVQRYQMRFDCIKFQLASLEVVFGSHHPSTFGDWVV